MTKNLENSSSSESEDSFDIGDFDPHTQWHANLRELGRSLDDLGEVVVELQNVWRETLKGDPKGLLKDSDLLRR